MKPALTLTVGCDATASSLGVFGCLLAGGRYEKYISPVGRSVPVWTDKTPTLEYSPTSSHSVQQTKSVIFAAGQILVARSVSI